MTLYKKKKLHFSSDGKVKIENKTNTKYHGRINVGINLTIKSVKKIKYKKNNFYISN